MSRILFVLKRREDFNATKHTTIGLTTGLYNSATFVCDMVREIGHNSRLVVVNDNNDIDREVTAYRPTHCIIEALWVVPSKFDILAKLHPDVKWIIRIHSELPFMANEGVAVSWFGDYLAHDNIVLAPNAPRMMREVETFAKLLGYTDSEIKRKVVYLPNSYPQDDYQPHKKINRKADTIHIGCFGAIRPLKNHLMQALAAAEFAHSIGKKLAFHVNAGRVEMKGQPVVNNLRGLFEHLYDRGDRMIVHKWTERAEFLKTCRSMDLGMQVTFTETFNIVAADLVTQGVPIITTKEIPWASSWFSADPTDSKDIVAKLQRAYDNADWNVGLNQDALHKYTNNTKRIWKGYFNATSP